MKKILILLLLLGLTAKAYAGYEDRKNFYSLYDPTSAVFVYSNLGVTSSGDAVAVNTATRKSIQITGVTVGEYIEIRVEGRSKDQINQSPTTLRTNWAILDTVEFGNASADSAINQIVDVTEHVDFLRIGIRQLGTNGDSQIDIKGIFTNLER